MLEGAEVEIGKHMPVHLLLHCDPYNPRDPEVKEWRVRMENVVAEYDPKFKLYDFRLKKENGKIILSYHMLIPRNYHITYEEIQEKLTAGMAKYSPAPEIKIEFLHSYI